MVKKNSRSRGVSENENQNTQLRGLEVDIETVVVNDKTWNCVVGMLVETRENHIEFIDSMADGIKSGLRRVVQSITYSEMVKTVIQLRNDKLGTSAMKIQAFRTGHKKLCNDAYPYLTEVGSNIPTPLLARLIKYQILIMKAEYIKQRERENTLAQEIQEESKLMLRHSLANMRNTDIYDKGGIKANESKVFTKKRANSKSQAADKTNVKEKKATKLRKRGEEWMDTEFIDDAPVEGPNLYILLSGFYDVSLAAELLRLGVPVCCMIKTQREHEDDTKKGTTDVKLGFKSGSRSVTSLRYASTLTINDQIRAHDISVFWEDLEKKMLEPSLIYLFKDVAFLTFHIPPSEALETTNKANLEQLMYDNISYLLYDLQDTIRQHKQYLWNMKVLNLDGKHLFSIEDMTIYNALLDDVPAECRTIPLTLHCMLQQVDFTSKSNVSSRAEYIKINHVEQKDGTPDVVKSSLAETFDQLNQKYGLADISRDVVDFKEPLIVIYGDLILKKTYHCFMPMFDVQQITCNMLSSIPPVKLWQLYRKLSIESKSTFQYQVETLLECVDEDYLEIRTLHNRLHAIVFRKMNCSKFEGSHIHESRTAKENNTKCHNTLKHKSLLRIHTSRIDTDSNIKSRTKHKERSVSLDTLPYSSERERWLNKHNFVNKRELICTEISDLLPEYERFVHPLLDGNNMNHELIHPRHFDKFPHRFVEEISSNVLLQTLQAVFSYFACMDHSYFAPTDTILIKFHNPIDANGVFEELYECHVTTPVSLRDFVEYVVEEESEWLQAAEKMYQSSFHDKEPPIHTSFVGEHVVDIQPLIGYIPYIIDLTFVLEGSLKHEKMLKDMVTVKKKSEVKISKAEATHNTQENNVELRNESSKPVTKKDEHRKTKEEKTGAEQKGKKNRSKLSEDNQSPWDTTEPPIPQETEAFVGVNLGPMRFQINGKTSYFCSLDGSRVKVHLANWLYKWKMLSLEFFKGGHTFVVHHYIGKVTTLSKSVAFHAVLDCGIVLAFERPTKKLFSNSTASNKSSTVGTHASFANRKIRKMYTESKHRRNKRKTLTSPSAASLHITSEVPDIQLEFVLNLSWPSGLFLETIKEPFVPFYVKQKYLTKGPLCTQIKKENFRCYLQNGNILKFMINGSVEILYPDSTIIVCSNLNLTHTEVHEEGPVDKHGRISSKLKGFRMKLKERKSESRGNVEEVKKSNTRTSQGEKELMFSTSDDPMKEEYGKSQNKLLDVTEYFMISPSGRQFLVKGGVKKEHLPKYTIRTGSDTETAEIFTRRGDSTNTLLFPDGTFVVHFKDGSRITQSVVVDPNEIFCEWTGDEVAVFYSKKDSSNRHLIKKVRGSYYNHVNEGYVLLRVMYRLEHPNYATVIYHDGRLMCELVMPQDNAIIKMFTNGTYCITASNNIQLEVGSDTVRFDHLNPVTGVSMCSSIVNLSEISTEDDDDDDDEPHMLSETTDVKRKTTFQVGFDGETHVITGEESEEMNVNSKTRALMRYFSLNRDLTGQEFILENEVEAITECVSRRKYSSIITDNFPDEPQLDFHIFMSSLDKNESESWLVEYTSQRITSEQQRISKFDTRSTYGDPPSWFHPFPKMKHLQSTRTSVKDSHVDSPGDDDIPDVLLVRMVKEIAPSSINLLRNVYKSLKKFRQVPIPKTGVLRRIPAVSFSLGVKLHKNEPFQYKTRRRPEWQDKTSSAARELYRIGRMHKLKMNRSERKSFRISAIEPLINKTMLKSWKNERKGLIIEYRNSLRHGIVAPYFSSYAGDIFLIIQDAVDRAVDLVEERRQNIASELKSEEMSIEEEESTSNITPEEYKPTTGDRSRTYKCKYRAVN